MSKFAPAAFPFFRCRVEPVSYTHLDVYKRQDQGLPDAAPVFVEVHVVGQFIHRSKAPPVGVCLLYTSLPTFKVVLGSPAPFPMASMRRVPEAPTVTLR